MKKNKIRKLEQHGWRVGSASDFLNLLREETTYVEMKPALALQLEEKRKRRHMTQAKLAALIYSSQSRAAKMEKSTRRYRSISW